MTAEPTPHALKLVTDHSAGASNWRAKAVLRQWDPEAQLVGALMHLPHGKAATILALVPDTAIWGPDNRWAFEIIRRVVDQGDDPDPVMVLRCAQQHPPADAGAQPVTPARLHRFAVHLANLYTETVGPSAVRTYAREVLEEAYRRAVGAHGARMAQVADSPLTRDEITGYLTAMRAELADLWRRAEAAGRDAKHPRPDTIAGQREHRHLK